MNPEKTIPAQADWVTVRSACSISQIFEKVKLEVEQDVEARNKLSVAALRSG